MGILDRFTACFGHAPGDRPSGGQDEVDVRRDATDGDGNRRPGCWVAEMWAKEVVVQLIHEPGHFYGADKIGACG